MELSLVLPCYNPQQGWERNIFGAYSSFCGMAGVKAELILVLDGVSAAVKEEDLQWLQAQIQELRIVRYPENRGKGFAIREGVRTATGAIIMYTDVDMPYSIDSMFSVFQCLQNNSCDVAIGVKDEDYYQHLPFARKLISRCLRVLIRVFLAMPITDTQCGLKGFKKDAAALFLRTNIDRYLFDLEFVRNCFAAKKYRVLPVPVTLNEEVHFRKMNYSILLPELLNFVRLLFKKPHE